MFQRKVLLHAIYKTRRLILSSRFIIISHNIAPNINGRLQVYIKILHYFSLVNDHSEGTKSQTDSPEGIRTETAKVQSKIQFLLMHRKEGTNFFNFETYQNSILRRLRTIVEKRNKTNDIDGINLLVEQVRCN